MKMGGVYTGQDFYYFAHGTLYISVVLSSPIAPNFYRAGYLGFGTFACTLCYG